MALLSSDTFHSDFLRIGICEDLNLTHGAHHDAVKNKTCLIGLSKDAEDPNWTSEATRGSESIWA